MGWCSSIHLQHFEALEEFESIRVMSLVGWDWVAAFSGIVGLSWWDGWGRVTQSGAPHFPCRDVPPVTMFEGGR